MNAFTKWMVMNWITKRLQNGLFHCVQQQGCRQHHIRNRKNEKNSVSSVTQRKQSHIIYWKRIRGYLCDCVCTSVWVQTSLFLFIHSLIHSYIQSSSSANQPFIHFISFNQCFSKCYQNAGHSFGLPDSSQFRFVCCWYCYCCLSTHPFFPALLNWKGINFSPSKLFKGVFNLNNYGK